ncbi:hypothetical protein GJW-30_1_02655 [Variibacter gotjawalensis]|uniref:YARHG domain-containing protein n=1 Tax=Variibacter gotjawalensis TaxID=1333996 RepID=A0A0S3PVZ5_9BRAD|nr:hypothetical protein [Variibacter gotjawalensis]NIK45946.1 hypothetical protein [Variibacter gotjawalensis]RZS47864.1 hypothetical protein EV661_0258 [Variibacter gotjawalensis]BAT60120.1 hypothetical protein GJW-30_1_02655 [Variibacter gotjawalensis]
MRIFKVVLTSLAIAAISPADASAFPRAVGSVASLIDARVCFYPDGWKGPGLYECGYQFNRGFGWLGKGNVKPRKHARKLSRRAR